MEIVYDEFNNVRFRLDDGREFKLADLLADLERLEKLETALTLTANSREWNRKRVLELEDTLERAGRISDYPSALDWAAVRAERDRLKERVAHLVAGGDEKERDKDKLFREVELLQKEKEFLEARVREYDRDRHTERNRADVAQRRVAELEKTLAASINGSTKVEQELEAQVLRLTDYADAQEARRAEVNEKHRQSIAARDSLLQEATAKLDRIRRTVWTTELDRLIENRGVAAVVHELADLSAAAISRVRAFTGQPE